MGYRGILVYDKADAEYNKWFIEHIIESGMELGLFIELKLTEELNSEKAENVDFISINNKYDFALMRNRNYKMSAFFEENGIKCFNSSYVCKIGNDKWEMYRVFSTAGVPVMYTQCSKLPYPFIMKPRDGHGGENVYLIHSAEEYEKVKNSKTDDELSNYIYQMPASEKGRDIRVYVVGDTIITAMERKAAEGTDEFRANFSLGGEAKEHALTDDELKLVAKTAERIKADFVGIDLIYNNGKPVVNEIEDAVGTRMLYKYTDIDPVYEYLNWVKKSLEG